MLLARIDHNDQELMFHVLKPCIVTQMLMACTFKVTADDAMPTQTPVMVTQMVLALLCFTSKHLYRQFMIPQMILACLIYIYSVLQERPNFVEYRNFYTVSAHRWFLTRQRTPWFIRMVQKLDFDKICTQMVLAWSPRNLFLFQII